MKRTLLFLGLMLCASPAFASFTLVNSCGSSLNGADTTRTCNIASVQVHDLVVIATSHAGAETRTCSDTASTFVNGTDNNSIGSNHLQFCYSLDSAASGTVTYTATWSASTIVPSIAVYVFRPTATPARDVQDAAGNGAASTAVASGNITTTGADELVFGAAVSENAKTYSSPLIFGAAATGAASFGEGGGGASISIWYKAATGTTNASATISASDTWLANAISFNISGGGSTPHNLTLLGVGH